MKAARGADEVTQNRPEQLWSDRFRLEAAADHHLGREVVDRALAEVDAASADAGAPAQELFGTPGEHARQVASQLSVAQRADAETDPGLLTCALIPLGLLALVGALYTVVQGGWSVAMSVSDLIGSALLALTAVAAAWVVWLRRAGMLAASWAGAAATAALVVTVAVVLTGQSGQQIIGRLPAVVLVLVGLGLLVAAFVVPDPDPGRRQRGRGRSRSAAGWYRRLGGLLRGRYRFPLARTRDLVAEARSHVAASAAIHPSDDLGEPGHQALALAEVSTCPSMAVTRTQRVAKVAVPLLLIGLTIMLVDSYLEGGSWTLLIGPTLLALTGLSMLLTSRRRRPPPGATPARSLVHRHATATRGRSCGR